MRPYQEVSISFKPKQKTNPLLLVKNLKLGQIGCTIVDDEGDGEDSFYMRVGDWIICLNRMELATATECSQECKALPAGSITLEFAYEG